MEDSSRTQCSPVLSFGNVISKIANGNFQGLQKTLFVISRVKFLFRWWQRGGRTSCSLFLKCCDFQEKKAEPGALLLLDPLRDLMHTRDAPS